MDSHGGTQVVTSLGDLLLIKYFSGVLNYGSA